MSLYDDVPSFPLLLCHIMSSISSHLQFFALWTHLTRAQDAQAWVGHRRWLYILWRHCSHHGNYFRRCRSAISSDLSVCSLAHNWWILQSMLILNDLHVFLECLGVQQQIGHLKSDCLRPKRNAENAKPQVHRNLTLSTWKQIPWRQTCATLSRVTHRSVTPWPNAPAIPVSEVALKSWGVQATTASLTQSRSRERRSPQNHSQVCNCISLDSTNFCSEIRFCCYTITRLDHVRACGALIELRIPKRETRERIIRRQKIL